MKQGLNLLLEVEVKINLDLVEMIEFIMQQDSKEMTFTYPSEKAFRQGDIICLKFTRDESYYFDPSTYIEMDTRITLIDSEYQPETSLVTTQISRTLFKEVEE